MLFADIQRQDRIVTTARRVQNQLIRSRSALRTGQVEQADEHLGEALNQLIHVIQHLQFSYAVQQIEAPNHAPALIWIDLPTQQRLEDLQQATGYSVKQIIIELLQSGQLAPADGGSGRD